MYIFSNPCLHFWSEHQRVQRNKDMSDMTTFLFLNQYRSCFIPTHTSVPYTRPVHPTCKPNPYIPPVPPIRIFHPYIHPGHPTFISVYIEMVVNNYSVVKKTALTRLTFTSALLSWILYVYFD